MRALNSVVIQTYNNYEIILVNDGSSDSSVEIVKEFISLHKEINIIHIIQKNMGPGTARNNGVRHANGKYIAFLDADDSWNEKKLEIQVKCFQDNLDAKVIGCSSSIIDGRNNQQIRAIDKNNYKLRLITFRRLLFRHCKLKTPGIIIKKEIFDELCGFPTNQLAEDYYLWLKVSYNYKILLIEEPQLVYLFKKSYGESGLTANLWALEKAKVITFQKLMRNKYINIYTFIIIITFSFIKYVRRYFITFTYNFFKLK